MAESLYDRKVSGFALSISTALAFESLFPPRQAVYDQEREVPEQIQLADYDQMWINVDTLFRNMMQSASKEAVVNTGYKEAAAVLIDELDTIYSLMNNEGAGACSPIFYVCDYAHALRGLNKAFTLRKDSTANQIHYRDLRDKTMAELKKQRSDIKFFPGSLAASGQASALILTHVPYDLLSRRYFKRLDLIESNTGKLKKPAQWNSKYYPVPGKNMSILPFYRFLLVPLGDRVLIQPSSSKLRDQIMNCAEKRAWTPMTTQDKCLLDLSLDLHPFDYQCIASAKATA